MQKILFVTYELGDVTHGGAGFFLKNAIEAINNNKVELEIYVLALFSSELDKKVNKIYKTAFKNFNIFYVDLLLSSGEIGSTQRKFSNNWYAQNSFKVFKCIELLEKQLDFDYIEFPDYTGLCFHTLLAKRCHPNPSKSKILIRLHGSMGFIYKNLQRYKLTKKEQLSMLKMEAVTIPNADLYLTPSKSIFEEYKLNYNIKSNKYLVSPPQVIPPFVNIWEENKSGKYILFYGRYDEIKGTDIFFHAALKLLKSSKYSDYKFIIAGSNSSLPSGRSYKDELVLKIPKEYKRNFVLIDFVEKKQLKELVMKSKVAVFCSKWESFCRAMHEMKSAGIPIIAPALTGFKDYFKDNVDYISYKNKDASDLSLKLIEILNDENLRRKISRNHYDAFLLEPIELVYDKIRMKAQWNNLTLSKNLCNKMKKVEKSLESKFNFFEQLIIFFNKIRYRLRNEI